MSSKEREVEVLKRMIHQTEQMVEKFHNDHLVALVNKHKAEETLNQLKQHLANAEKELADEVQSVQDDVRDSGQLRSGGSTDIPQEVSSTDEDEPGPS